MIYYVKHQEEYSRGQLLLRAFFGIFYIGIPHGFLIMLLSIGLMFVRIGVFWICLFTGKYPQGLWDYQVKFMRYQLRVNARFQNLADGYPEFGLNGQDDHTNFDIAYKEEVSRGTVLIRALFGVFLIIPHAFALIFRLIATMFVQIIAFWIILFTGKFPDGMFDFVVGTGRWAYRVNCYLNFYTPDYPPFTGKILPGENEGIENNYSNDDILDEI